MLAGGQTLLATLAFRLSDPKVLIDITRIAALRFIVLGLFLIALMAWRPQGLFGKREEMVLGE